MAVDLRKIKKLIELVQESGIAELAITEGEESIRITRYGPHTVSTLEGAHNPPPSTASSPKLAKARDALPVIEGFVQVSPMVGTFYRASSPGAKPFAEIGQAIKEGFSGLRAAVTDAVNTGNVAAVQAVMVVQASPGMAASTEMASATCVSVVRRTRVRQLEATS